MTAIIAVRRDDSVCIYSDAVGYDDQGIARHFHQKTDIIFHLPAILATRGSGPAGQYLKMLAADRNSFDELIDRFADLLRIACDNSFEQHGEPINLSAYVGGYSEIAEGWRMYNMHYAIRDGEEVPDSFKLQEIASIRWEPSPPPELLNAITIDGKVSIKGDAGFVRVMQMMRDTDYDYGPICPGKGCIVGGFIQKTVLSADNAYTEIIHRWDDKIGMRLNRYFDDPVPNAEVA